MQPLFVLEEVYPAKLIQYYDNCCISCNLISCNVVFYFLSRSILCDAFGQAFKALMNSQHDPYILTFVKALPTLHFVKFEQQDDSVITVWKFYKDFLKEIKKMANNKR